MDFHGHSWIFLMISFYHFMSVWDLEIWHDLRLVPHRVEFDLASDSDEIDTIHKIDTRRRHDVSVPTPTKSPVRPAPTARAATARPLESESDGETLLSALPKKFSFAQRSRRSDAKITKSPKVQKNQKSPKHPKQLTHATGTAGTKLFRESCCGMSTLTDFLNPPNY